MISKAERFKAYDQTPNGKYRQYKHSAKKRNLAFDITIEEFTKFWRVPCTYCGFKIHTIGLDRVNNELGYRVGNLTSCCQWCNVAKGKRSPKEFIQLCEQVTKRHSS